MKDQISGTAAGVPALLARTGYTGEDGFELFVASEQAPQVWQSVLEAGAEHGLVPCGLACRDTLRLEAGMPLYGQELTRRAAHRGTGQAGALHRRGDPHPGGAVRVRAARSTYGI